MKLTVTVELKTTAWIPGTINPVRPGYYQRDRRTRVPLPKEYFSPDDVNSFIAQYPPADAAPPSIGKSIALPTTHLEC